MPTLLDDPDISAGLVPAKGEDPDISAELVPMKSSAQDDPDLSAGFVPISAPTQTPVPIGSGSSREQDNATLVQPRVAVPAQPAGAVGPLPSIPQPQVDMRVPSVGQTLTGVNPKGVPPTEAYDYGGAGVNEGLEGIKQLGQAWGDDFSFNSQDAKQGLTKTINGVMSAGGSSMIGQASPMAIRALAAAVAGGYVTGEAARRVTKALGLDPDAQDLAAALGNIAGGGVSARVAAGGLGARAGAPQTEGVRPEYRSTPEPSVEIPNQKALPAPEKPGDVATHVAGKVTAIDAHTGLPIVDRTRPSEATLSVKGEDLPPQSGEAGKMSPEAEKASAERSITPQTGTVKYRDGKPYVVDQKTGWWVPRESASAEAGRGAAASAEPSMAPNPIQQIGTPENGAGRIILQPSNSVSQNQELATAGLKEILPSLKQTISQIPGASLDAVRETKDADRTREKVEDEGKSPASIPDFSALRISVDSPAAKTQLADAIRSQFPIAREKDEFASGSPDDGFNAHMMQVQSPNGATHEIQILPKETADIAEPTHDLYEQARGGDQDARASLRQQNAAAMEKFNQRNQSGQNVASSDDPDISAGLVPRIGQGAAFSRPINVQTNFPPTKENAEPWNRAANNSTISTQFSRLGIKGFSIDSPHEFGLSEQANIDPSSGQIRVSAAAHDPEQSIAHELAHDIYNRLSPQNRELVDGYVENSTAHREHAGGLVERMADHFGDVMAGRVEVPAAIKKAFFDSDLAERPARKTRPSETAKLEPSREGRKSWTEIARAGGSIHQGDDLQEIAREHGDFPIVIKDTFGGRHVVPASVAGELANTEGSGYIREMWMAKDHIREEANPEEKLARNEQMLSADRYFNALGKDEIDPNSRPLDKPYRAQLEQQNADLRAEIDRRKSGEKYAPKPAYPAGTYRIDGQTGARPLSRALKIAENRQRLTGEGVVASDGLDLSAGLVPNAEPKPSGTEVSKASSSAPGQLRKGQRVILPDGRSGTVEFYDSGLTKRARVVADDGERIPSIAGKSLTPLAPVNIGEPKTNSPLEASMTKKVREKGPQLVAKYLKDNTTDGVPYIGTDQAKRLFLEYSLNPTAGNEHSDQAASAVSHAAWDTALAKPVTGNKNMVRILTGAPASGKTTAIKEAPPGTRVGINRESIIGDAKYGAEMFDQVLASGRKPEIHLVYTDDPRINVQRMIDRAKQIGRVVPIDYMARTFVSVPKAIAQLHERYGDKIAVDSFDTSGPVKMHRGTVEPAVAATSKWNEQTALEAMNEELERLHQAGDVPEAIYSAAKQPFVGRGGSPAERGADITGSEPRSAEEKGLQLNAGQRQASTPPERTDETANTVRTARESAGGGGSARESEGAEQSNGVDKKESGGTFYSGFLDPELFKTLFPDIADRMSDWLSDEVTPGDEQKEMMRQTRGEMDRRVAAVAHKLEVPRKSWMMRSRADSMAFWNAVESGDIARLQQRDQALARTFKGGFDKMKADLQKLKPEVLQNYIENYFPHIWEQPSQARKIIAQVLNGKRPFAGSASFLKQRTIPTMQDGINMGLTPKSWNPVDQFLTKYSEMAQFLMGHQTLDMMKSAGTAKMVRVGEKAPSGWSQLDDRIGTVMSRDVDDHLFIRGHYYAPPDAARAFNNFVSRGLAGRSGIYDTLTWMNNNMNALQLGISAFHATTTSVNAATSEIALGIKQLSEGKPIKAAGHILSGASTVPSVIRTVVNGSRLMREYLEPGSYAKMSREAAAIAEAGGRIKQNTLELKPFEKMANAFRNGAIGEGLSSIPGTILHATVAPVMEYWVPRMKLGAFYDMAHDVLDQSQKNGWDAEETRRAMQKAWDSVDNRFGQVVYDNLFWHKAMRDALQLATRSVGWNYGSLAELGGAATDTIKEANKGLHGDRPEVTDRMAFAFALPLYTALVGATLTYLWTGEKPDTWKDYFYPKRKDGTRVSIPGYMKDVVAFSKHPEGTIENKMAPIWEMTGEAINNRAFYGTEIRHKDDNLIKQFEDVAKWAAGVATPFAFSGTQKMLENKGEDASMDWHHPIESAKRIGGAIMHHPGDLALGNLGFQPAPAYIQNSPALNLAREYGLENRPPGTKTQAQAERQKAMHSIEDMYRTGNVNQATIDRYVSQGKIVHADIFKARMFARTDPLAYATRALTIEQALNVYDEADDKEKQLLRPILEAKRKQIHEITDPDKRQEVQESFRRAMGGEALQVAHVHGGT